MGGVSRVFQEGGRLPPSHAVQTSEVPRPPLPTPGPSVASPPPPPPFPRPASEPWASLQSLSFSDTPASHPCHQLSVLEPPARPLVPVIHPCSPVPAQQPGGMGKRGPLPSSARNPPGAPCAPQSQSQSPDNPPRGPRHPPRFSVHPLVTHPLCYLTATSCVSMVLPHAQGLCISPCSVAPYPSLLGFLHSTEYHRLRCHLLLRGSSSPPILLRMRDPGLVDRCVPSAWGTAGMK